MKVPSITITEYNMFKKKLANIKSIHIYFKFQLHWNIKHLTIQSTIQRFQIKLLFKIPLKFSTHASLLLYS